MGCKICEREFKNFISLGNHISRTHKINSRDYYDKFLKKENEEICPECGKETKFIDLGKGYCKFCSRKCMVNSKDIQEKKIQTCLKHFGVEHPFQNKEVQDKSRRTCLKNLGTEYPFQNKEVQEKYIQTCIEKYGVEHPNQNQKARERQSERMKNGGAVHASSFIKNPSKPQVELYNLVKSLFPEAILNFPSKGKSGDRFSLDIVIPSLKIDVEYDCWYWHDPEKDRIRQEDLESLGWKFLRYKDYIPTLEELKENLDERL